MAWHSFQKARLPKVIPRRTNLSSSLVRHKKMNKQKFKIVYENSILINPTFPGYMCLCFWCIDKLPVFLYAVLYLKGSSQVLALLLTTYTSSNIDRSGKIKQTCQ